MSQDVFLLFFLKYMQRKGNIRHLYIGLGFSTKESPCRETGGFFLCFPDWNSKFLMYL